MVESLYPRRPRAAAQKKFQADNYSTVVILNFSNKNLLSIQNILLYKNLIELDLSHNKLNEQYASDFSSLTYLKKLSLAHNFFTLIPNLPKLLEVLAMEHNHLTNLENNILNCKRLQKIDLSYNELTDISLLRRLEKLTVLLAKSNKIVNIDFLFTLSNIQEADFENNLINHKQIFCKMMLMPTIEIINIRGNPCNIFYSQNKPIADPRADQLTFEDGIFMKSKQFFKKSIIFKLRNLMTSHQNDQHQMQNSFNKSILLIKDKSMASPGSSENKKSLCEAKEELERKEDEEDSSKPKEFVTKFLLESEEINSFKESESQKISFNEVASPIHKIITKNTKSDQSSIIQAEQGSKEKLISHCEKPHISNKNNSKSFRESTVSIHNFRETCMTEGNEYISEQQPLYDELCLKLKKTAQTCGITTNPDSTAPEVLQLIEEKLKYFQNTVLNKINRQNHQHNNKKYESLNKSTLRFNPQKNSPLIKEIKIFNENSDQRSVRLHSNSKEDSHRTLFKDAKNSLHQKISGRKSLSAEHGPAPQSNELECQQNKATIKILDVFQLKKNISDHSKLHGGQNVNKGYLRTEEDQHLQQENESSSSPILQNALNIIFSSYHNENDNAKTMKTGNIKHLLNYQTNLLKVSQNENNKINYVKIDNLFKKNNNSHSVLNDSQNKIMNSKGITSHKISLQLVQNQQAKKSEKFTPTYSKLIQANEGFKSYRDTQENLAKSFRNHIIMQKNPTNDIRRSSFAQQQIKNLVFFSIWNILFFFSSFIQHNKNIFILFC